MIYIVLDTSDGFNNCDQTPANSHSSPVIIFPLIALENTILILTDTRALRTHCRKCFLTFSAAGGWVLWELRRRGRGGTSIRDRRRGSLKESQVRALRGWMQSRKDGL